MDSILAQLKTQIEELEIPIKSLSYQVTTQGYMTGLKTCLEEIKALFSTYQTQLNEHLAAFDSHLSDYNTLNQALDAVEEDINIINSSLSGLSSTTENIAEIESAISTINSTLSLLSSLPQDVAEIEGDISIINSSISTISYSIDNLEDADTALSARITTLENSSGGSEVSTESIHFSKDQINAKVFNGETYTYRIPRCQFICDTSGLVTISYQIVGKMTDADASYFRMRLYLNDELVKERDIDGAVGGFIISDSYTFIPQQSYNYFYVQLNMGGLSIREYSATVEGKNVEFLRQDLPLKINCFNDSYYILLLDDYRQRLYYGVQAKGELDISTSSLSYIPVTNSPEKGASYLYMIPNTKIVDGTVVFDTDYSSQFKFVGNLDKTGKISTFTLEDSSLIEENMYDVESTYLEPLYGGMGVESSPGISGEALFVVDTGGFVGLLGSGSGVDDALTINSFIKLYISNYRIGAVVRDINNKIGSPSYFRGVIVWDLDTKMNVFLPSTSSTYTVNIADGKNVTAYYQTNGDINVYINRGINVYKYVLQKNLETSQYELSSQVTTIEGITRYEELYDGKYLVYRNTKWEIVTP